MMIEKKAYAKINLGLDVKQKLSNGYHQVDMIMTSLELHDTLIFEMLDNGRIEVLTDIFPEVKLEENIVYQAAILLKETCRVDKGARITLKKRIPMAAGLAGGSSDAAATLHGLNELWHLKLGVTELEPFARKLGADVPYCLYHQTARVQGIGEQLEFLPSMIDTDVMLVKPTYGISTALGYAQLNWAKMDHPNITALENALHAKDFKQICQWLGNSFEYSTFSQHPELEVVKNKLHRLGVGVLLSGSGPTLYALVQSSTIATRVEEILKESDFQVIWTRTKRG